MIVPADQCYVLALVRAGVVRVGRGTDTLWVPGGRAEVIEGGGVLPTRGFVVHADCAHVLGDHVVVCCGENIENAGLRQELGEGGDVGVVSRFFELEVGLIEFLGGCCGGG